MTAPAPLLNTAELSRYLAIPEATLVDWRYKETGPPYFKVGGQVRYALVDVDEWLTSKRIPA